MIRILIFILLISSATLFAGRNIQLSFTESFDDSTYARDLVWVSPKKGATHEWMKHGGWRGGSYIQMLWIDC